MAISYMITMVVDVGQGQCTFACIYDDSKPDEKLIHTLLFDCGSDSPSPSTPYNITYIAKKLATMAVPAIDLLVFSHSDNDHISLMYDLLNAYTKTGGAALSILKTWYAGDSDYYEKYNKNILFDLETKGYCKSFTTPDFGESQYDKKKKAWKTEQIWISPDKSISVGMLVGNVIDDEPGVLVKSEFGSTGEKKNRVSIVCALMHNDRSLLICGDATNRTMAWVNNAFGGNKLNKDLMVTLPHHGSRATGLNVTSGNDANKKAIAVVQTFVVTASAKTATISAFAQHDHPSMELVAYFAVKMTTPPIIEDDRLKDKAHFMVCNVDEPVTVNGVAVPKTYQTLTTVTNVYATYYYGGAAIGAYNFITQKGAKAAAFNTTHAPAVNGHACWCIVTFAGAGNSLQGYKTMLRSTTNSFTDLEEIPETVAGALADAGPIVSRDGLSPVDVDTLFPASSEPPSPPFRPPVVLSSTAVGVPIRRLRVFR